jgi:hypothetical protein
MANFRTTLWFKKGELDAAAAQDPEGPGAADLLPIEDRYRDDGSVNSADTAAFGLRSGQTQAIAALEDAPVEAAPVPREVITQLKGGRLPVLAAIGASVIAIVLAVWVF